MEQELLLLVVAADTQRPLRFDFAEERTTDWTCNVREATHHRQRQLRQPSLRLELP